MNEIIDNEFGAVKNFLSKYKNALMIVVLLIILSIGLFALNFYNKKVMNEEAAVIYNEWLNTTSLENKEQEKIDSLYSDCLLYTSPSPRDGLLSRMPSSA